MNPVAKGIAQRLIHGLMLTHTRQRPEALLYHHRIEVLVGACRVHDLYPRMRKGLQQLRANLFCRYHRFILALG